MRRAERRIGDHAIIGNGRSVALVARDGAITWLAWPRVDSPSLFAALLDEEAGGEWRLSAAGPRRSRRYLPDTNVLETTFETPGGVARLTDAMAVGGHAEHQILRRVEGVSGQVELEHLFDPRPDYARRGPRLEERGRLGVFVPVGRGVVVLRSPIGLGRRLVVRAGEVFDFTLTWAGEGPAWLEPGDLERTIDWWRRLAGTFEAAGPWHDAIVRSALCLKLLVHAPSGAILAAPTTSLPERIGGPLNWDYRYCWLRDAAFTVRALYGVGLRREAEAFVGWLTHATALTRPELRVLYDVYGERPPREEEVSHLHGHRGSRPVRRGNAAARQLQLDIYGEVIDAVAQYVRQGGVLDGETRRLLGGYGEVLRRRWREPDSGIWEPRGPRRRHTHSAIMSWVAFDRLGLHDERQAVAEAIEREAWNEALGAYAGTLGGDDVDAAVLLAAQLGYRPAADPRLRSTWRALKRRLGAGPGLLYRYPPREREGAFAAVSFWAAEYLALAGQLDEAEEMLEDALGHANDVGLMAEEIDPATGEALGNFPQAFTHVGLICAARTLTAERTALDERRELAPVGLRLDGGPHLHPGG